MRALKRVLLAASGRGAAEEWLDKDSRDHSEGDDTGKGLKLAKTRNRNVNRKSGKNRA